jgi:hypothetical protein
MEWLRKLLDIKPKGKFIVVFSKSATWDVDYGEGLIVNKYCHFDILHNDVTNEYKLECRGYNPESHSLYETLFKYMRRLNEGTSIIKGGEIYNVTSPQTNTKDVDTMNETECQVLLDKAVKDEDYELAEKLRKRLEKF